MKSEKFLKRQFFSIFIVFGVYFLKKVKNQLLS